VNIHLLGKTVLDRLKGSETQPVYIRCEENVKFGDFVIVIDALKQANVTNISIVTEPLETSKNSS
jgi:biopolymer transport protein ExbD/biopolymer transport protein TolR